MQTGIKLALYLQAAPHLLLACDTYSPGEILLAAAPTPQLLIGGLRYLPGCPAPVSGAHIFWRQRHSHSPARSSLAPKREVGCLIRDHKSAGLRNCLGESHRPGGPSLSLHTTVGSGVSSSNPAPDADNPRGRALSSRSLSLRRGSKSWPVAAVCLPRRKSRSASARRSSGSFAATRRTRAGSSSCCCWVSGRVYPERRSSVRVLASSVTTSLPGGLLSFFQVPCGLTGAAASGFRHGSFCTWGAG